MIPRGEVSLIFAQIGLTSGLLSTGLFNSVTVMVIITAFLTPLLLRMLLTQGVPEPRRGESELVAGAPMDESIRTRGAAE
jgi:Kef-type K+ transport system membrane component KefB